MTQEEYALILIVFDDIPVNNIIAGITNPYAFTGAVCDNVTRDGIVVRVSKVYAQSVGIDVVLCDSIIIGIPKGYDAIRTILFNIVIYDCVIG